MPSFIDSVFTYLFYIFIFVTIFLLSGSVYGINFYLPMCLLILPFASYSFFYRQRASFTSLALLFAIPIVLAVWSMVGLSNGFDVDGVKGQTVEVLLTLYSCWLAYIFSGQDSTQKLKFIRVVLTSVVASCLLKICLILYAVTHGMPVIEMVLILDKIFGSDIMTMDLGSLFGRVQFAADATIPVCIFIVLRHRGKLGLGNLLASLTILVLLISVLFSFSRYYWAFSALAFLLGLFLGKRDKFQLVLACIIGVSVLASLPALSSLYELRFSTAVAGGSDTDRTAQIPRLEDFFTDAPFIGHGLGSYTTRLLRASGAGKHNYELQLLAFLGQVGLVGTIIFLGLLFWYFDDLWLRSNLSWVGRMSIALLLLTWIAGGFSNPIIFNPIAGIVYALLASLTTFEAQVFSPRLRTDPVLG